MGGPGGGTGFHLGMSVSDPYAAIDAGGSGGAFVAHGSGFGVTDSAGLLAGTPAPTFKDVTAGGSISGWYDASRLLPTNQSVQFGAFFAYDNSAVDLGPIAGLNSAGSAQFNTYTFAGSFFYSNGAPYVQGIAGYNFGTGSETNAADGSNGSFSTNGYSADLRMGTIFPLLGTPAAASPSVLPTKAPPAPPRGYVIALDVSGHIGYNNQQVNGFTDSSGFIFGTDQTHYGDVGAEAKLFAVFPSYGLLWMPYVAGTVDQLFGFSSTLNIPSQPALVGGDVASLTEAQTFYGAQLGLDARAANGWTIGVKGFYTASADMNFAGGNAYIKIPLNYTPAPLGPRY
jgi:hypothetical protein